MVFIMKRIFVDARQLSDDSPALKQMISNDVPIRFNWDNRWLKGDEYSHIINHMDSYCEAFDLLKFEQKTHPESIYTEPESKRRAVLKVS
jgi:hypothetical protein